MFGLLGLPNLAESLVAGFAFTDFAHLLVQVLQALSFCVQWHFNRALLGHECHLVVGVFVRRAVKDRADLVADGHVVHAPIGSEQSAIAEFCRAI